jgi:Ran GTPase-activating protein (RanGAP) involved in mRNA processing and transport
MRSARVSFLTCIQRIRSERKGQKRWREVWIAIRPSPLSISQVHSADMDAFRTRVISHVYSGNQIGKEGAEALPQSLERNSSLTSLDLTGTLCRYGCVPCARVISHVYSDNQIGKEGAEALARSLERNSSLTSLDLRGTLCRYGCVQRASVISHVYSVNQIGKEGAEALARALERNSSLIQLCLEPNTGADSAACTQCG